MIDHPIPPIILFGFSGSGKSTMAEAIAARYRLRVIHPSGIMRDILSGCNTTAEYDMERAAKNTGYWESPGGMAFLKARLHDAVPLDMQVDRMLIDEARRGDVVIDSWSLPWHVRRHGIPAFCVYLQADTLVRTRRVSARDGIRHADAARILAEKDEDTRHLFIRLYGFDIALDHGVFDWTINTDTLGEKEVFSRSCVYLDNEIGYRNRHSLLRRRLSLS